MEEKAGKEKRELGLHFTTTCTAFNLNEMAQSASNISSNPSSDAELRLAYFNLFHEMQFRCTKNAMMNYSEAEKLQANGDMWKNATNVFAVVSASGVMAGILQRGKLLASKTGLAGLIGLPVCGVMELLGSSSSDIVPSFHERAKKHACAAAGWMKIADLARTVQIQMKVDPNCAINDLARQYSEMLDKKEIVSKEVLIPRSTHSELKDNTEMVYMSMMKRKNAYQEFIDLEAKQSSSAEKLKKAEDDYI